MKVGSRVRPREGSPFRIFHGVIKEVQGEEAIVLIDWPQARLKGDWFKTNMKDLKEYLTDDTD